MSDFYYSPGSRGFYLPSIHGDMPSDAMPVTQAEHAAFMQAQDAGASIVPDGLGQPSIVWPDVDLTAQMSLRVDAERDRRISSGFLFGGVVYQSRPEDRENIAGAKSAASDAIALGALSGDLGWQRLLDPSAPAAFAWIAADNSLQPMDAQTVVQLGYAALRHKQAMIFAARALKDTDPIPSDFADDAYWPTA